ncbi:MAG: hypothetical protein ACREHV_06115, partial [Rhizomicrobium sp.]
MAADNRRQRSENEEIVPLENSTGAGRRDNQRQLSPRGDGGNHCGIDRGSSVFLRISRCFWFANGKFCLGPRWSLPMRCIIILAAVVATAFVASQAAC